MNPKQAKKVATAMIIANILLALSLTTVTIGWIVDYFIPTPPAPQENELADTPPPQPKESDKTDILAFKECWEAPLLEQKPQPTKSPPPKKAKEPPKKTVTNLPFLWCSVMMHSQPEKSYAVILDTSGNTQILVKEGDTLPKSDYRVIAIAKDKIKIADGSSEFIIHRPKPWLDLKGKKGKDERGKTNGGRKR